MTSKRKQSGNALPFHGVIVAGSTKAEAINKYRDAILGNDAQVYVDEDKTFSFLSSAETGGMTLFNPSNGMLNLSKSEALTARAEFVSEASGDLEANYTICSDGCGSHIIFDDNYAVSHCPVCASDLEELTDSEINEINGDDDDAEVIAELEGDGDDLEIEEVSESSVDEDEDEDEDVEVSDIDDDEDDDDEDDDDDEVSESSEDKSTIEASDDEDFDTIIAMDEEDDEDEDDDDDDDDESNGESKGDDAMDIEIVGDEDATPAAESSADNYRGIVVTASSRAAAVARYKRILSGAERVFHEDIVAEDCIVAASSDSDINYSPVSGEPTMIEAEQSVENIETVVASDDNGDVEVNMMVCSSAECGHYTVSDEEMTHCAVCGCTLTEPKAAEAAEAVESVEESDELEELAEDDEETVESNVNLLASAINRVDGGKLDSEKLDLAFCGVVAGDKRWQAFYDGVPVAFATANSAAKHAHIFEGAAFANAVAVGARNIGVAAILDDMGFTPVIATVNLDRNIEAEATAQYEAHAQTLKNDFEQTRNEYIDRFVAALATAAQGVNRGFFKDEHNTAVQNPIKTALWEALNSVGISQPEVLIDSAYKAHSDDYHKIIIAKATEIMGKPLEVQNELAKSVDETMYREAHASAVTTTVADKLAGVGDSSTSEPAQTVTASDSDSDVSIMKSVVSGLGKRPR